MISPRIRTGLKQLFYKIRPKKSIRLFIGVFLTCLCLAAFSAVPILTKSKDKMTYTVFGVKDDILVNVEGSLKSTQRSLPKNPTQEQVEHLYEAIPTITEKAMAPYGYFQPKVILSRLQQKDGVWHVDIHIVPGTPVRVKGISIQLSGEGKYNPVFTSLVTQFPLKIGDVLNTKSYDDWKKAMTKSAAKAGFMSARFEESTIEVHRQNHAANIMLRFNTGPQYYFGKIQFHQEFYDEKFLERFLKIKTGQPYSPDALQQLQQDLNGTQYFSTVSVDPMTVQPDDTNIPVDINLAPSKAKFYNLGLGYGTDTGPRATVDLQWRHLTDTGQHFDTYAQISRIQTSIDSRYVFPGKDPLVDQYYLGASFANQTPDDSNKGHTKKLTAGKQGLWHQWKTTLALSLQYDRYMLNDTPYQDSHLILPSLTLYKNNYDNIIFPHHGYSTTIIVRGAAEPIYSTTSFAQGLLSPKYIFSPTNNSRVLLRGDLGLTSISDPSKLPLSLQYYAGGSNSIRGYDYEELGPGRYLVVGSAEYQHKVYGNWYGTIFSDSGNAVNSFRNPAGSSIGTESSDINLSQLFKTSAGLGIMYASPVGPLELTLAKPITDPDKHVAVQFTMGANL